jgi:hypothetical protein
MRDKRGSRIRSTGRAGDGGRAEPSRNPVRRVKGGRASDAIMLVQTPIVDDIWAVARLRSRRRRHPRCRRRTRAPLDPTGKPALLTGLRPTPPRNDRALLSPTAHEANVPPRGAGGLAAGSDLGLPAHV